MSELFECTGFLHSSGGSCCEGFFWISWFLWNILNHVQAWSVVCKSYLGFRKHVLESVMVFAYNLVFTLHAEDKYCLW